jgi:hypothetical protein
VERWRGEEELEDTGVGRFEVEGLLYPGSLPIGDELLWLVVEVGVGGGNG